MKRNEMEWYERASGSFSWATPELHLVIQCHSSDIYQLNQSILQSIYTAHLYTNIHLYGIFMRRNIFINIHLLTLVIAVVLPDAFPLVVNWRIFIARNIWNLWIVFDLSWINSRKSSSGLGKLSIALIKIIGRWLHQWKKSNHKLIF